MHHDNRNREVAQSLREVHMRQAAFEDGGAVGDGERGGGGVVAAEGEFGETFGGLGEDAVQVIGVVGETGRMVVEAIDTLHDRVPHNPIDMSKGIERNDSFKRRHGVAHT